MKVFEMRAFTWVITGLLDSGKTTLINRLLKEELSDTNVLVLQFEEGEEPLIQADNVRKLVFSKKELEKEPFSVAGKVILYLEKQPAVSDADRVEWNRAFSYIRRNVSFFSSPNGSNGGTGHLRGRRRTHGKPDHGCRTSHIFPDCRK